MNAMFLILAGAPNGHYVTGCPAFRDRGDWPDSFEEMSEKVLRDKIEGDELLNICPLIIGASSITIDQYKDGVKSLLNNSVNRVYGYRTPIELLASCSRHASLMGYKPIFNWLPPTLENLEAAFASGEHLRLIPSLVYTQDMGLLSLFASLENTENLSVQNLRTLIKAIERSLEEGFWVCGKTNSAGKTHFFSESNVRSEDRKYIIKIHHEGRDLCFLPRDRAANNVVRTDAYKEFVDLPSFADILSNPSYKGAINDKLPAITKDNFKQTLSALAARAINAINNEPPQGFNLFNSILKWKIENPKLTNTFAKKTIRGVKKSHKVVEDQQPVEDEVRQKPASGLPPSGSQSNPFASLGSEKAKPPSEDTKQKKKFSNTDAIFQRSLNTGESLMRDTLYQDLDKSIFKPIYVPTQYEKQGKDRPIELTSPEVAGKEWDKFKQVPGNDLLSKLLAIAFPDLEEVRSYDALLADSPVDESYIRGLYPISESSLVNSSIELASALAFFASESDISFTLLKNKMVRDKLIQQIHNLSMQDKNKKGVLPICDQKFFDITREDKDNCNIAGALLKAGKKVTDVIELILYMDGRSKALSETNKLFQRGVMDEIETIKALESLATD
jgi:hypothetical protein